MNEIKPPTKGDNLKLHKPTGIKVGKAKRRNKIISPFAHRMGDKMEDETLRGGYKEALLSAAGKRERTQAHTGVTPPAKAASPGRNDDTHRGETNPATLLEDLSMEEEILPQWSVDEDDEALLIRRPPSVGRANKRNPPPRIVVVLVAPRGA